MDDINANNSHRTHQDDCVANNSEKSHVDDVGVNNGVSRPNGVDDSAEHEKTHNMDVEEFCANDDNMNDGDIEDSADKDDMHGKDRNYGDEMDKDSKHEFEKDEQDAVDLDFKKRQRH